MDTTRASICPDVFTDDAQRGLHPTGDHLSWIDHIPPMMIEALFQTINLINWIYIMQIQNNYTKHLMHHPSKWRQQNMEKEHCTKVMSSSTTMALTLRTFTLSMQYTSPKWWTEQDIVAISMPILYPKDLDHMWETLPLLNGWLQR